MECVIYWKSSSYWEDRRPAGARIAADLAARRLPFHPCHRGPVTVSLTCIHPSRMTGKIRCTCGAVIGALGGTCDGSDVLYTNLAG